jgi:hypothetical protein
LDSTRRSLTEVGAEAAAEVAEEAVEAVGAEQVVEEQVVEAEQAAVVAGGPALRAVVEVQVAASQVGVMRMGRQVLA